MAYGPGMEKPKVYGKKKSVGKELAKHVRGAVGGKQLTRMEARKLRSRARYKKR